MKKQNRQRFHLADVPLPDEETIIQNLRIKQGQARRKGLRFEVVRYLDKSWWLILFSCHDGTRPPKEKPSLMAISRMIPIPVESTDTVYKVVTTQEFFGFHPVTKERNYLPLDLV